MPWPTLRFLRLLAWGSSLWFVGALVPGLWLPAVAWLLSLGLIFLSEWRRLARLPVVQIRRLLPARFCYHEPARVTLEIKSLWDGDVHLWVREETPDSFALENPIFEFHLGSHQEAELSYEVLPRKRGAQAFGDLVLRFQTGLQLVQFERRLPAESRVKVYPRFRQSSDYEILARLSERQEARRPRRLRGQGSDYESLRPYVPGDDPRLIDWKSSARRASLISRNPEAERGQQISLLIDAGRMMQSQVAGHSRLEHAIEAAVRLCYVIQKRGDAVALAAFSHKVEAFVPTLKGPQLMGSVLEALSGIEGSLEESDYWTATAQVLSMFQRRSLIVFFTEVVDAAASQGLINNLRRAARRHLVLCVVLSEPQLLATAEQSPVTLADTWRSVAACDLLQRRRLALEHLRASGILILECSAAQLSSQLIRRYLEIRQADLQ